MNASQKKQELRARRHIRVRAKVSGTADCPRLSIFRSTKHIYAQIIDDVSGKTLVAARDSEIKKPEAPEGLVAKTAMAYAIGVLLADKAKKAGLTAVVFDRGGYAYHGRVKAVADGARAGGLEF